MRKDINEFVDESQTCAENKYTASNPAPTKSPSIPTESWEILVTDLSKLPMTWVGPKCLSGASAHFYRFSIEFPWRKNQQKQ